jgi:dTDP-glucose 4,6-dehydratase
MTKRLLLTGIGGSIGCHTMRHILQNTDWDVVGIDSFRHKGLTDRIEVMLKAHPEDRPRVKIFTHDIAAPFSDLLVKKIGKLDYIINMGSLSDVHDSIVNPVPFIQNNVNIALNMLEFARIVKPDVFLQISTDEIYGPTDGKTFHKEWDPIVPSNAYSASKAAQEAIAIAYWRSYNVPLVIVNLMNNFGEMQSAAKFPAIVQRKVRRDEVITIHGSAQSVGSRHYIHSRNSADAFLFILRELPPPWMHEAGDADKPDRYNIEGHRQVTNVELVEMIAGYIGKPAHYVLEDGGATRPGHDHHYGLNGSKLRNLGWEPPLSLEASLKNTVEWYEENPEWLDPH